MLPEIQRKLIRIGEMAGWMCTEDGRCTIPDASELQKLKERKGDVLIDPGTADGSPPAAPEHEGEIDRCA